ncbi:MAG: nucleoside kinase [Porphyromonas sp.]|nr:nucleoside kinase [Porphyromonas sp.]
MRVSNSIEQIQVYIKNLDLYYSIPIGTKLKQIADEFEKQLGFKPINAQVNHRTQGLTFRCYHSIDIEFVGISQESGMRTYERTLAFVAAKAVHDLMPAAKLYMEHSLSKGYYCRIEADHRITDEAIERIKGRMWNLIERDLPFRIKTERTEKVVALFREMGLEDKAKLIESTGDPYTTYHELDGYPNYFYGCLAPSTGYIHLFDLIRWMDDGLLLQLPRRDNVNLLQKPIPQPKMRDVIHKHNKLLSLTQCKYVGSLNRIIDSGQTATLIQVSEAMQEKEIASIAADIARLYSSGVRVVLISGPSSSGKTTFCKRLEIQLITNYIRPHGLSLDDYFVDREQTPLDANGEYDFEDIRALDLELLGNHISQILAGKEVELPTFDFTLGKRVYKGKKMQIKEGDLLVMEGIHALNPDLLPGIPTAATYRIYVSALTNIALDAHNRIPSTDNRLLRRIVRDYNYRSYSAIDTIKRWPSVRAGEERWVFPFQENANVMFNSAMVYELAVLKPLAEQILRQVPRNLPEFAEATRLLRFLSYFHYIPLHILPHDSLLREFVGGSIFAD